MLISVWLPRAQYPIPRPNSCHCLSSSNSCGGDGGRRCCGSSSYGSLPLLSFIACTLFSLLPSSSLGLVDLRRGNPFCAAAANRSLNCARANSSNLLSASMASSLILFIMAAFLNPGLGRCLGGLGKSAFGRRRMCVGGTANGAERREVKR